MEDRNLSIGKMKAYTVAEVRSDEYYCFAEIVRRCRISLTTLRRWRQSGRLVVCSTNRTLAQGQRIIEAVQNRLRK